ncbi:MAG: glycosyltransferase family 4 protein [Parvibaculum sp.]|uniref:glycosyltransferase family 4 protein n=1 Tax=Parvibaculum sp. TaxID=2024848 RepID=UPI0028515545|nr:glycosyltransferase family 4 protein [Parvibaculum sp.]MDR3498126.1 glycosyltransferase family 4 protein [Parvibaculum sp.]
MKIAQIAPLVESVPPTLYGGTERVVSWLTEELVRQGHDVTLFASGDSRTLAELVPIVPRALRLDGIHNSTTYNLIMLDRVASRMHDFDVMHFHIDFFHYPLFRNMAHRTLTTLHGRQDLPELPAIYRAFPHMPLVSISDHQREPVPPVNWRGTVYHGLPNDLLAEGPGDSGYLAFLGRICPDKGPLEAIEIARRAGSRLKMAAKVDPADQKYFDEVVKPVLDRSPHVEFIGEIDDARKPEFLGKAKALLFPICWPEPFGLVMIESMACGTPVIAFNCGSVPEIMEDGLTGFVVEDVEQAVAACGRLDRLSRAAIRSRFEERFSVAGMARQYVKIYEDLASMDGATAIAAE